MHLYGHFRRRVGKFPARIWESSPGGKKCTFPGQSRTAVIVLDGPFRRVDFFLMRMLQIDRDIYIFCRTVLKEAAFSPTTRSVIIIIIVSHASCTSIIHFFFCLDPSPIPTLRILTLTLPKMTGSCVPYHLIESAVTRPSKAARLDVLGPVS